MNNNVQHIIKYFKACEKKKNHKYSKQNGYYKF